MAETQEDSGSVKRVSEVFGIVVLLTRDGNKQSFVTTDFRGANEQPKGGHYYKTCGHILVKLAERDDIFTDTPADEVEAMVLEAHQKGCVVGPK